MGQLEDMSLFTRIIDAGGIGKAADQLNLAKSAVSRRLSELESRLGTQLISRTTRQFKLTAAGEIFYQRCLHIAEHVETSNNEVSGTKTSLSGTLRVTAPTSFGLIYLSEAIDQFIHQLIQ